MKKKALMVLVVVILLTQQLVIPVYAKPSGEYTLNGKFSTVMAKISNYLDMGGYDVTYLSEGETSEHSTIYLEAGKVYQYNDLEYGDRNRIIADYEGSATIHLGAGMRDGYFEQWYIDNHNNEMAWERTFEFIWLPRSEPYRSGIIVEEGATLHLYTDTQGQHCAFILGGHNNPAIEVQKGGTLIIHGDGDLICVGGPEGGPGIGEEPGEEAGTIIVARDFTGSLLSIGQGGAAGIGSAEGGSFESIQIYNGNVYGIGGDELFKDGGCSDDMLNVIQGGIEHDYEGGYGAGIGSGKDADIGAGESIFIGWDAHVEAFGGTGAAGIGTGHGGNIDGGYIHIAHDVEIYAAGGAGGAGIGTGISGSMNDSMLWFECSEDSDILAYGSNGGAGIGSGVYGNVNTEYKSDIRIEGGNIKATGGTAVDIGGAGIGYGALGGQPHSYISILGGNVEAIGGNNAAGIGGGTGVMAPQGPNAATKGGISIYDGNVTAIGNGSGAGIGSGGGEMGGFVEIQSGVVYASGERRDIGGGLQYYTDGVLYLDASVADSSITPPVVFLEHGTYPSGIALGDVTLVDLTIINESIDTDSNSIFGVNMPPGVDSGDDTPSNAFVDGICVVSFESNCSQTYDDINFVIGRNIYADMLPFPESDEPHMNFTGWYTTEDFQSGTIVSYPYQFNIDTTLYAKFSSEYEYEQIGDTATAKITGYNGFDHYIVIPTHLKSKTGEGMWEVKAIGEGAFQTGVGTETFVSYLIIPHGIERIEADAFKDNYLQYGFDLPESVTYIGEGAFVPGEYFSRYIELDLPDNVDVPEGHYVRWRYIASEVDSVITYGYYDVGDGVALWDFNKDLETVIEPIQMSVTYDGNANDEGTVPIDSNTYTIENNEVTILSDNGLNKNNYTFGGWEYADGFGSSTIYHEGDIFTIDDDVTFNAVWNKTVASDIILSQTNIELNKGETFNLNAIVSPDDTFDTELIWICNNPIVASLIEVDNKNYTVVAEDVGYAEITVASIDGGAIATCSLLVKTPDEPVVQLGELGGYVLLHTGEPIEGVELTMFSTPVHSQSDINGRFSFGSTNYTNHTIVIHNPLGGEFDRFNIEFVEGDIPRYTVSGHDITVVYSGDTLATNFTFMANNTFTGFVLADVDFDEREYINPQTGDKSVLRQKYYKYLTVVLIIIAIVITLISICKRKLKRTDC